MKRNKNAKRLVVTSLSLAMAAGLLSPAEPTQAAKVKFNVKSLTITVGSKKTLKLKNTKKAAKWSVKSGKDKIKLQKKKKSSVVVVAKKAGSAKVMAKIGKKKYLCSVKVKATAKKNVQNTDIQPAVTSAPTAPEQPAVTPNPGTAQTPTEVPKPSASVKPSKTPDPSVKPSESPDPSVKPSETPDSSVKPSETPIPNPDLPVEKNAEDVLNLQKLIAAQTELGATVSADLDDKTTYKWNAEGRLTEIYWGERGITATHMSDFNNFPALEVLDVNNNNISGGFSIDKLENLQVLKCYGNKIGSLLTDANKNLVELDCHDNQIGNDLILSDCKNLKYVYCSNNKLTNIELSGCDKLQILDCSRNSFTKLEVSDLPELKQLDCSSNNLKDDNLILTGSTGIVTLDCSLNATGEENLNLNLKGFTNLETLNCSAEYSEEGATADQGITLDLSDCMNLKELNCSYAAVSDIEAENLQNLEKIEANGCYLEYMRIAGAKNLQTLNIADNAMEELTFPEENAITVLDCNGSNSIEIMNFEVLTKLQTLDISDSTIINEDGLDFSKCVELKTLDAENVSFGEDDNVYEDEIPLVDVDLSANVALEDINFDIVNVGILTLPLQDTVKNLSLNGSGTTSIVNCEKQVGLLTLDVAGCDITALDLTKNVNLKQVTCLEEQKAKITGVSEDKFHIVSTDLDDDNLDE
mgnify:CR=1 FL=1